MSLTYFHFFNLQGEFFHHTYGVAMGSALSRVVVNFSMEDFETKDLASAPFSNKKWERFIDDTCVF